LNVPFAQKDEVKKLGAKWDADSRGWWIPISPVDERFYDWVPQIYRQTPPVLKPDLIPEPCWGLNLRSLLTAEAWQDLRTATFEQAGKRCVICGGRGPKWPVECDEEWEFIEDLGQPGHGCQRLIGLRALCPGCHAAKHIGKAHVDGREEEAFDQLSYVNSWTQEQCEAYVSLAFTEFDRRSEMTWSMDLSILQQWGISEVMLNAYDFEPIPLIEGVEVVVFPTYSMIFNLASEAVDINQLLSSS
ncbi:DUF5710 domain-containing protein, partial [Roseomonas mucosa]|uniref:DUF5710 domain-containing protein n=1 Tax=Roseomonas mucosa TaxID=207340 RepID=UPI001EF5F5C6